MPLPDEKGRAKIMAVHLRKTPMATAELKEQCCAMVASLSSGMSGAELANVCNEAALLAGRRSAEVGSSFPGRPSLGPKSMKIHFPMWLNGKATKRNCLRDTISCRAITQGTGV